MQNFKLFLSIFLLITSVVFIVLIAVTDTQFFLRAAEEIQNYPWTAGIAVFILIVLLSVGFVTHSSEYEGSLFSNSFILLAILEIFLFTAGLAYFRYYTQQSGQFVLRLQADSAKDHVQLSVKYESSSSVSFDTVEAPGILKNRSSGSYTFEIIDEDVVYFRREVDLKPAATETVDIPVVLSARSLSIETDPPGADIWINGLQASQTPHTFQILTGDTVYLELRLSGYEVYMDTITDLENTDLGLISLKPLFTLWISCLYDYMEYRIIDSEQQVVYSGSGSRKIQLEGGTYRIAYEIGEGQYQSKSFTLNYNSSIEIP